MPVTSYAADVRLAMRCRAGDLAAFEELYRAHSGRLYAVAYRMLGHADDAEDMLQEISLPKGMGVDVRNISGSVALADVTGDVRVEALSGSITGRGLSRLRSMRTMSGDIAVEASTLVGDANLQTVSGSVTATALKASSLTLGSVSGDIQLKNAGCDRVNVRTVSGNIKFASPAVGGGRYELKTHAGSIVVLTGVKSAGFEFEAQTFKGRVHSDVSAGGTGDARQLAGRVGNGSAFFDLTSFVGNIHIRK